MTSSQPPTPGGYGPPPQGPSGYPLPAPGQPPAGQPPAGQQSGSHPSGGLPPGQPQPAPPPPGQAPYAPPSFGPAPGSGQNPYGQPAGTGSGFSFDPKKLRIADYVVVGGMILYLVMAILPWVDVANYLGFDLSGVDTTVSGFQFSGLVTFSFVLFFLAAAWAVLPAFTELKVGFPRAWITVGLAALGFVLTLIAWIRSLTYGFEIWALIGLLAAAAIVLFAFLGLMPEMRNGPALPGRLAGAAQWANQQAPPFPGQFGAQQGAPAGQSAGPPPAPPYGQPPAPPYGQPPAPPYGQHAQPYVQPPAPPYGQPPHGQPVQRYDRPPAPPYGQPAQQYGEPPVPPDGQPARYAPPPPPGPGVPPAAGMPGEGASPGGSTASGLGPTTPGGPSDTPGGDAQRPVDPA